MGRSKSNLSTREERNRAALSTECLSSSLGVRTARGGIISVGTQVLRTALQLLNAAIMARLLAPADFGLVAMAMVVTGFAAMFADFGLTTLTVQRKTIDQDLVSGVFWLNILIGIVIMLLAWVAAPVAAVTFGDARVTNLVIAMAAILPVNSATSQHTALLMRRMRWSTLRANEVAAQIVGILLGVAIAGLTGLGYWALVASTWATAIATLALAMLTSGWRPSAVRDWASSRSALGFGANLTFFSFTNWFNRNLDNALIGWRWGATELGFYTRAYQLLMLPINLVSGPVASAVMPALSRMQDEPERWRVRLIEAIGAVVFLSSGLTAIMIATSDSLIRLVYGEGWEATAHIFQILLYGMFSSSVLNSLGWIYVSLGRTDRLARWGAMAMPVWVSGFALGITHGVIGVASAFAMVATVLLIPAVLYATKDTPIRPRMIYRAAAGPITLGVAAGSIGRYVGAPSASGSASQALQAAIVGGGTALACFLAGGLLLLILDEPHRPLRRRLESLSRSSLTRIT